MWLVLVVVVVIAVVLKIHHLSKHPSTHQQLTCLPLHRQQWWQYCFLTRDPQSVFANVDRTGTRLVVVDVAAVVDVLAVAVAVAVVAAAVVVVGVFVFVAVLELLAVASFALGVVFVGERVVL